MVWVGGGATENLSGITTLCPRVPIIFACSHASWAFSCCVGSIATSDVGRARRVDRFELRALLDGSCSTRVSPVFDLIFKVPEGAGCEVRRLSSFSFSRSLSSSRSLSRLDLLFTSLSDPRAFSWSVGDDDLTGAGAVGDRWRILFDSLVLSLSRASLTSPLPVRLCEGDLFEP